MRPKLVPPSEETKHICEPLVRELLQWPDVRMRSMFGLRAVYRASAIFAMLPDKRALENPRAIAYKLESQWRLYELDNPHAMGTALVLLDKAYRKAR